MSTKLLILAPEMNVRLVALSFSQCSVCRCADVWPGDGVILAAGQASGRVSLVSFREGEGRFLLDRGELSPR